jgi:glycosyltransferase involved in cell wall biosynthesis
LTRVFFTHRHSMAEIRRACAEGSHPYHHLWGADALERAGFDVRYGRFARGRRALAHLSWRLGGRLGDIEEEAALARLARGDAIVYAGEATIVSGLARLRRRGCGAPLVAVVHSRPGPWTSGLDVAVCLSDAMRARLIERYGRDPARTPLVAWGPDLKFSLYAPTGDDLIISAGQTARDQATLLRALDGSDLKARVYAGNAPVPDVDGVEVVRGPLRHYGEVLEDLRRASVVAIPLQPDERLLGLTELNDALALGKPVVMTRTEAIDLDPERIGCGFSVEPGDARGWRTALERLQSEPDLRARMGARGRAFAEREHNADVFRAQLVEAVRSVAAPE